MPNKDEHISELNIHSLRGRVLNLPSQKKKGRTILLIPGLHSSIERMRVVAEFHSQFGEVIMPDLPGFGGMDSFYKVGLKPSLDSYADYLYTFIKTRKFDGKITFIAMSFGFLIVTRMLQKYPQTQSMVKDNIAVMAFGRDSDFLAEEKRKKFNLRFTKFFSRKLPAAFVSFFVFNRLSLRLMFFIFRQFNPKYKGLSGVEKKAQTEMELILWRKNDARTKFYTWNLVMGFDLTKLGEKIDMKVHDMHTSTDQYFDATRVKETLMVLYSKHQAYLSDSKLHAPSVMGTLEEIDSIYAQGIKDLLAKP